MHVWHANAPQKLFPPHQGTLRHVVITSSMHCQLFGPPGHMYAADAHANAPGGQKSHNDVFEKIPVLGS